MREVFGRKAAILSVFLASFASAQPSVDPLPTSPISVPIAPASGEWDSLNTAGLAFNPITNRILTVVRRSDGGRVISTFDAGTNAFSGGAPPLLETGARPLKTVVSASENALFIAWGSAAAPFLGSEREIPIGLERFDLNTFESSDSILLDVRYHRFDYDRSRNRLVGVADPGPGQSGLVLKTVDIATNQASAGVEIGIASAEAIARDAVFDPATDQLIVLFLPTKPGNPNQIEQEAFLVGVDTVTGATVVWSATFAGEFTPHSLALSPDSQFLAVIPSDSNRRQIPLLDAESLTFEPFIEEASLSPTFKSNGAGIFVDDLRLWIANATENTPQESVAIYDLDTNSDSGFVSDASECEFFEIDREAGRVFAGSQSLQQIHLIDTTTARIANSIDVSVRPFDLTVDRKGGVFQLLSRTGHLHLVSDGESRYLERRLGFSVLKDRPTGFRNSVGLLSDQAGDRLFVGRRASLPPSVLDTNGYREIAQLPVTADALAFDASRNILHAIGFPTDATLRRTFWEIDGTDYSVIGERTVLLGLPAFDPPSEMAIDEENRETWWLTTSFFSSGSLRVLNPESGALRERTFPGFPTLRGLVLDPQRDRVLMTVKPTADFLNAEIQSFAIDSPTLEPAGVPIDLDALLVLDLAEDLEHDLLYCLLADRQNSSPRLAIVDLRTDTVHANYRIDAVTGTESAQLAFNPSTNRFALAPGTGDRLLIFENPTHSSRRPSPPPPVDLFVPGSVGTTQTASAIRIGWTLNTALTPVSRGVEIDRRVGTEGEWIRLTPLPIPPTLNAWTDVTGEPGIAYSYRLRSGGDFASTTQAVVVGPVHLGDGPGFWRPVIPEAVVGIAPGHAGRLDVLLQSDQPSSVLSIQIKVESATPVLASVTPTRVLRPGTARIQVTVPESTPEGVYPVTANVRDASEEVAVTTLIEVPSITRTLRVDGIHRFPTPILLTSDSDLDARRLSVRGQLGLLRTQSEPAPVIVRASRPDGGSREARVIASAGEFTADFSIPEASADGEWTFEAVFHGTVDSVGGVSLPFRVPLYTGRSGKGNGPDDFDLGQIVIAAGKPPEGDEAGDLDRWAERLFATFASRRFKEEDQRVEARATVQSVKSALTEAAAETSGYILLYLLADAAKEDAGGIRLLMNEGESLAPSELAEMVSGVASGATPLVVLDAPYAGRFLAALEGITPGASIFAASSEFGRVGFGADRIPFTDLFSDHIDKGRGFGEALEDVKPFLSYPSALVDPQLPHGYRTDVPPYRSLVLGSHLTPSRSLIRDRIPPVFLEIEPTVWVGIGESIPLSASVQDPPFDRVESVEAFVRHPDGFSEHLPLERFGAENRFIGVFGARIPGVVQIVYRATDDQGNSRIERSTAIVGGRWGLVFDARELLELVEALANEAIPAPHPLFGVTNLWRQSEEADR